MTDCPTPSKSAFRSRAAAARWHRRAPIAGKARLIPYLCPSGTHWHLTHGQRGWNDISLSIDAELEQIAIRAAARYPDNTLCIICLDAGGHGEFATITAWAEHVEAELRAAGLKVTRRATTADDEATEAMF